MYKVSCKDFVAIDKEFVIMVWAWLYGCLPTEDDDPVIDFKDLAERGQKLFDFCSTNPTVDIITAAEPIYERKSGKRAVFPVAARLSRQSERHDALVPPISEAGH